MMIVTYALRYCPVEAQVWHHIGKPTSTLHHLLLSVDAYFARADGALIGHGRGGPASGHSPTERATNFEFCPVTLLEGSPYKFWMID